MSTSRGKGAGGRSSNNNPLASALDKSSRGKGQKRKGSGSDGNSNSKSSSKRGGGGGGGGGKRGGVDLSRGWKDEEIESGDDEDITDDDDDDNDHRDRNSKGGIDGNSDSDDDDIGNGRDETLLAAESAEQKRRRLATEYLNTIKDAVGEDSDNEDGGDSGDEVGDILRKNRLDSSGRLFKSLSSSFTDFVPDASTSRCSSSFEGAVTCVALSSHGHSIYTASKDGSLIHHDTETGKRSFIRNRHNHSSSANGGGGSSSNSSNSNSREAEQLSTAVSTDDRFIAAGGRDKKIRIYDCRARNEIKILEGHRDAVTCLAFKHDSADLFSGSLDRCLKQWNLNDMAYIETTFGHQDGVTSIDCWTKSKPVSASGDRTVRIWKMAEDSHLVYRGPKCSIDAVKYVSEEDYLSGGQDGNLHLWKAAIKKPKCVITAAHGYDLVNPRWVTSIGALKMTDLSFSGSYDGFLRVWKTSVDPSSISSLGAIPIEGFINSIDVKEKNGGLLLAVGTGREHKFGRWWNLGGNKDKLHVLRIPANS